MAVELTSLFCSSNFFLLLIWVGWDLHFSFTFTQERKFDERSDDEYPDRIEQIEEWCLRDVIFVEEVRNVPIGRVLKVDGAYALVHFSPDCNNEQVVNKTNVKSLLNESRLLRKDELQVSVIEADPVDIYLLEVNNRNTRASCEIFSKLTIKTPEQRLFAFAFNTKSFAIAFLVFFHFFLLVTFSGRVAESVLVNVLS